MISQYEYLSDRFPLLSL